MSRPPLLLKACLQQHLLNCHNNHIMHPMTLSSLIRLIPLKICRLPLLLLPLYRILSLYLYQPIQLMELLLLLKACPSIRHQILRLIPRKRIRRLTILFLSRAFKAAMLSMLSHKSALSPPLLLNNNHPPSLRLLLKLHLTTITTWGCIKTSLKFSNPRFRLLPRLLIKRNQICRSFQVLKILLSRP